MSVEKSQIRQWFIIQYMMDNHFGKRKQHAADQTADKETDIPFEPVALVYSTTSTTFLYYMYQTYCVDIGKIG